MFSLRFQNKINLKDKTKIQRDKQKNNEESHSTQVGCKYYRCKSKKKNNKNSIENKGIRKTNVTEKRKQNI